VGKKKDKINKKNKKINKICGVGKARVFSPRLLEY
jgi:hypothetical protein